MATKPVKKKKKAAAPSKTAARPKTAPSADSGDYVPMAKHQAALDRIAELESQLKGSQASKNKHLQCPVCWPNLGGSADRRKWQKQVSGRKVKRCYSCGKCGAQWIVEVNIDEAEDFVRKTTRVVEVRENA